MEEVKSWAGSCAARPAAPWAVPSSVSLHLKMPLCDGAPCRRVSHRQGFVPPPRSHPLGLVKLRVTDKRKRKTGRGEATQTVKTVKESSGSLGSSGMGMRAYIFQREAPREK